MAELRNGEQGEDHENLPIHELPFSVLRKGVDCNNCGRHVRIYRKRLNRYMMEYLIAIHKRYDPTEDGWVQASRIRVPASSGPKERLVQTGDYKTLAFWGLAELDKERAGFARITDLGRKFLRGEVRLPASVFVENYRNRLICFDGPDVSFQEAYGTGFDLKDL